jgi:uncharacterized membrane protein YiaA
MDHVQSAHTNPRRLLHAPALILGAAILVTVIMFLVLLLPWETVVQLTEEDGLFEYLGSLACLIAGALFLVAYLRMRPGNRVAGRQTKRNILFLLIAVGLLFIGAEEISWGQRIFHIRTPEVVESLNDQGEFNLHNIEALERTGLSKKGFNTAFLGLVFLYAGVIPVVARLSGRFRRFIETLNAPLPPPLLCCVLIAAVVGFELVKRSADLGKADAIGELPEVNLQILFLLLACWFLAVGRAANRETR